jgi:separase
MYVPMYVTMYVTMYDHGIRVFYNVMIKRRSIQISTGKETWIFTHLVGRVPGSPTAVANLWDVTDVDIDRFASAVLDSWLGPALEPPVSTTAGPSLEAAVEQKRATRATLDDDMSAVVGENAASASLPAQAAVGGSDADVSTASGVDVTTVESLEGRRSQCIAATIAAARHICRLPHLIGAAPVCYGIPTQMWTV